MQLCKVSLVSAHQLRRSYAYKIHGQTDGQMKKQRDSFIPPTILFAKGGLGVGGGGGKYT